MTFIHLLILFPEVQFLSFLSQKHQLLNCFTVVQCPVSQKQYSANEGHVLNGDPSSHEPLESCDWPLWHWDAPLGNQGNTAVETFNYCQLSPAHGWFPKLPPTLTSSPPVCTWCASCLADCCCGCRFPEDRAFHLTLCFLTSCHDIIADLLCNSHITLSCWSQDLHSAAFIARLQLWSFCVVFRFQLGLFSTPFLPFSSTLSSLDLIVLGTQEQSPILLCQMLSLFTYFKPCFLKWSFCVTHDQCLQCCPSLEIMFYSLFQYHTLLRFFEARVFHSVHLWTTVDV